MPNWSPVSAAGRAARTPLGVRAIHSEVHAIFDVQHVAVFEVAFRVLGDETPRGPVGGHKRTVPRPTSARPGRIVTYLAGCDVRSEHSRRLRHAP
jgi:hypothetical protein